MMNKLNFLTAFVVLAFTFVSCGPSEEKEKESPAKDKDTIVTDESSMPKVEEVEMEIMYEITYIRTKQVVMMTQDQYLESGIWENPDVVIKEVPKVK